MMIVHLAIPRSLSHAPSRNRFAPGAQRVAITFRPTSNLAFFNVNVKEGHVRLFFVPVMLFEDDVVHLFIRQASKLVSELKQVRCVASGAFDEYNDPDDTKQSHDACPDNRRLRDDQHEDRH